MQGTGGAHKLRWGAKGKGRRGGARVITFYGGPRVPVFLLAIFTKGERANLSKAERNELRQLLAGLVAEYEERAEMSKAGQSILRGARQALGYARGEREGFIAHVP